MVSAVVMRKFFVAEEPPLEQLDLEKSIAPCQPRPPVRPACRAGSFVPCRREGHQQRTLGAKVLFAWVPSRCPMNGPASEPSRPPLGPADLSFESRRIRFPCPLSSSMEGPAWSPPRPPPRHPVLTTAL